MSASSLPERARETLKGVAAVREMRRKAKTLQTEADQCISYLENSAKEEAEGDPEYQQLKELADRIKASEEYKEANRMFRETKNELGLTEAEKAMRERRKAVQAEIMERPEYTEKAAYAAGQEEEARRLEQEAEGLRMEENLEQIVSEIAEE